MNSIVFSLGILLFGFQINATSYFSEEEIKSKEFVRIKSAEWSACRQIAARPFFNSGADNPLTDFLETNRILRNLKSMEERHLTQAKVEVPPWSGDYWAYASGLLGARPFNADFKGLADWRERYEYIKNNPANSVLESQGQAGILFLSASEKYDFISGDLRSALTQSMWLQGKQYFDEFGKVESWMGICHGWSAASIVEPRPAKSVEVPSFDQSWQIRLVPSEIKGIASYTWANNPYPVVTVGERCNKKNPIRDENGRLTDPECFDLNPATWHMAIVNQVGVKRRSFIMDATYDYEVWNFPVRSYSYTYFNLKSGKQERNMQDAAIPIDEFTGDPYKKYRSDKAASIVGISMKVSYTVETAANKGETDSPENDRVGGSSYRYDLELDADGNLIGGEWHQNIHPDFIWKPLNNSIPNSPLDSALSLEDWSGVGPIPAEWADAAQRGAARGIILNTISKALIQRAAAVEPARHIGTLLSQRVSESGQN